MAKLNAVLVNGGIVDGVRILSQEGCNRALAEWKEEYDPPFFPFFPSLMCLCIC